MAAIGAALEEHPCLHFEVCYYQAIDFAIAHRLARVEAGAQGAHKLARGYLPVPDLQRPLDQRIPALRRAVADYLKRERRAVAHEIALLGEESPYRQAIEGGRRACSPSRFRVAGPLAIQFRSW